MDLMTQIAFALLALSFGLSVWNNKLGAPLLGVLNRWLRWGTFSLLLPGILHHYEVSDRPYWVLAVTAFLGWFLLETIYNWLVINALSRSEVPLFPRFKINYGGDEWPTQKRFLLIRDWIRENGFKKAQSLKCEFEEHLTIRSTVYENAAEHTRLQVLFFPFRANGVTVSYSFSSITKEGERFVTENNFMPFGGYYPESWSILRKPLNRSIDALFKLHRRRIKGLEFGTLDKDLPLEDINGVQRKLEQQNMKAGFLLPTEFHEEHGRLTFEGRYRVWKEIWLLNYFGRPVSNR